MEKKLIINKEQIDNDIKYDITINDEDVTVGNPLREIAANDPNVKFIGYKRTHLLTRSINIIMVSKNLEPLKKASLLIAEEYKKILDSIK